MESSGKKHPLVAGNPNYAFIEYQSDLAAICGKDEHAAIVLRCLLNMTEKARNQAEQLGEDVLEDRLYPFEVSYDTIMRWCQGQVSRRTMTTAIDRLIEMGYLEKARLDEGWPWSFAVDYIKVRTAVTGLPKPENGGGWPKYVPLDRWCNFARGGDVQNCMTPPAKLHDPLLQNCTTPYKELRESEERESSRETLPPYPPSQDGKGEPSRASSSPSAVSPSPLPPTPPLVGRGSLGHEEEDSGFSLDHKHYPSSMTSHSLGLGDTTNYRHSLPNPPTPPSQSAISTAPIEIEYNADNDWDLRTARMAWKRIVPKAKWNKATDQYVEQRMEAISDLPWSTVEAAMQSFVSSEAMREKNYPYQIFWKNPQAWMPDNCEVLGRRSAAGGKTGQPLAQADPTPQKPMQRDFVGDWNRACKSSPVADTLYRAFGWRDAVANPEFLERFDELADLCERLRCEAGKSWVNLPWALKTGDGMTLPNWKRILNGEYNPREVKATPEQKEELAAIRERLAAEQESAKDKSKESKRLAEEREAERDRVVAEKARQEMEARRAAMTPEERDRHDARAKMFADRMTKVGWGSVFQEVQKVRG